MWLNEMNTNVLPDGDNESNILKIRVVKHDYYQTSNGIKRLFMFTIYEATDIILLI